MNKSKNLFQEFKFLSIMKEAVNANKMMATIHLPQSQQDMKHSQDFMQSLIKSVNNILPIAHTVPLEFTFHNLQKNFIYLIIGAENGFCGGFNANILHFLKDIDINAAYIFGSDFYRVMPNFNLAGQIKISFKTCSKFASYILNKIQKDKAGLKIIYTNSSQEVIMQDLLPLIEFKKGIQVCELDQNIQYLGHIILATKIYKAIKESDFAENMQRIISMEQALDNCIKSLNLLKIKLNKIRQERITNEILQIVSSIKR